MRPWKGPPLGDGKVPPEKPHGSSVGRVERCHLPHHARPVALLAQHRPPGREPGLELAAAGDQAAGLVRVEAGDERAARRRAVVRGGEVALEGDGAAPERRDVGEQPVERRGRREPARRAHLVDDDHEDVRSAGTAGETTNRRPSDLVLAAGDLGDVKRSECQRARDDRAAPQQLAPRRAVRTIALCREFVGGARRHTPHHIGRLRGPGAGNGLRSCWRWLLLLGGGLEPVKGPRRSAVIVPALLAHVVRM